VAFFRNLLLNEQTPLHNRDLHISLANVHSAIQSANSALSKSNNCTLEETAVLQIIQRNPRATQKQIAEEIGKSERTVKTITVNLTQKGIIVRRNGKRDGYWDILEK
jgi:DNA-binding MarR family transcriptional regulator